MADVIEVERFDVSKVPDHRRPRVMELRGRQGRLAVHCSRENGSLWLFAQGPKGGDRGEVVFPVRLAAQLGEWLDGGARGAAPSTTGVLWLDRNGDARTVAVKPAAMRAGRPWRMPLDDAARDELLAALREWCATAEAVV